MPRPILFALIALALAGCTLAGGGDAPKPLETEAISVTSLDAPEGAAEAALAGVEADAVAGAEAAPEPATEPSEDAAENAAAPATEAPPEVAPPLSPAALACTRRGGRFVSVADGAGNACVRTTRDAGKTCRKESDCEGRCLARSGTCSPIDPLFGCNEILQDNGRRVTLCLE